MRITFLGTGTSHGVPTLDCMLDDYAHCPRSVCRRALTDPRYRRSRCSIAVQANGATLLVDTSQDFRTQMLAVRLARIDAVLYTHGHADHIYGLPDIRSYCRHQGGAIDILGSEETLAVLREAFGYAFAPPDYRGGGIPEVQPHLLDGPTRVAGLAVTPIPVEHGPLVGCQGYRLGDVAYIPDVKRIPPTSLALLGGLDLLILNCLRLRPHAGHLSLGESLAYVEQLQPRRCLLTHMTHDIDADADAGLLPERVAFAYDGLVVELP
ncbi:MAG: MBL fold metallo-hydrolase [Chloroflexota bacterium]